MLDTNIKTYIQHYPFKLNDRNLYNKFSIKDIDSSKNIKEIRTKYYLYKFIEYIFEEVYHLSFKKVEFIKEQGFIIAALNNVSLKCYTGMGSVFITNELSLKQKRTISDYKKAKRKDPNLCFIKDPIVRVYRKENNLKIFYESFNLKNKKVVIFGDSITDGCLLDPNSFNNGFNYKDTFFTKLCLYAKTSSNPLDLTNINFACSGTTISYGLRHEFGISGVERVSSTIPFYDGERIKNVSSNLKNTDICFIFYGTNDFSVDVIAKNKKERGNPCIKECTSIYSSFNYMIRTLKRINRKIKIIVLSPLYRATLDPQISYIDNENDLLNNKINVKFSEYLKNIEEVCKKNKVRYVNWFHLLNKDNLNVLTNDGIHPNIEGHKVLFDYLKSTLLK